MSAGGMSAETLRRLDTEAGMLTNEKMKQVLRKWNLPVSGNKGLLHSRIKEGQSQVFIDPLAAADASSAELHRLSSSSDGDFTRFQNFQQLIHDPFGAQSPPLSSNVSSPHHPYQQRSTMNVVPDKSTSTLPSTPSFTPHGAGWQPRSRWQGQAHLSHCANFGKH